jgi:hypothetical protein
VPVIFMPEFLGAFASGYNYRRKKELRIISAGAALGRARLFEEKRARGLRP